MRVFALVAASLASMALAQNCGPQYQNQVCAAGKCCSQYGWCDTTPAHCDPATCLKQYSGTGSSCKNGASTTLKTSSTKKPTSTSSPYASSIPVIDVCGSAQGGVSCPGAGLNGYFYRCCSSAGHCGPKNDIQDQSLYCGTGCQAGYGKCDTETKPPEPTSGAGTAQAGGSCGPIVNKKCASGLCCSGSNFCGTGTDFCGAANWCQPKWGKCS
ncbi:carbohydrate-binding module family 18 protein [Trematosphaeria pertusa]|uniref:Carbohydrate-binding module family 18 protein n=1 Tax=Trematosphaeria pertusa TaxID=390896 RepID=A0A6A6J3V1_9PLEO|nr:carbohydrate-binding module family 18 protein [Trematosphaeria pertusa]KAF2257379.1 carbohydrate-binding module family 18 protein [Trematosphaeria pertusa]